MKKKLSLLLVLALMISLVPMSAFAASDNSVNKIVTVKKDAELKKDAPVLKIENDEGDFSDSETFVLTLENAEWLEEDILTDGDDFEDIVADYVYANLADGHNVTDVTVDRKSDTKVEVTVSTDGDDITKDLVFMIPLYVEMQGEGAATVSVESKSGAATESEIKFAIGAGGDTIVTIEDTVDFSNKGNLETIEIEETAIGAIDLEEIEEGYIKLKLDKDFEFEFGAEAKIASELFDDEDGEFDLAANKDYVEINSDEDEIKIFLGGAKGIKLKASDVKSTIEISGLVVKAGRDADEGKVELVVSSNIDEIKTTTLEIGTYAEYKVEVKADGDPEEIYSGRYEVAADYDNETTSTTDADHELQVLVIDEKVEGSWTEEKSVVVEFPSWVKIVDYKIEGDDSEDVDENSIDVDENEFEFEMKDGSDAKKKVEITFYVSVEAGKTGDITAKVSGKALDEEYEVVLGKAIAPVKVEAEVAKLKAGVRDQEIGKITISETDEECIKEGKDIVLELDKDLEWDEEPTVKVVKGDLEIDEDDIEVDENILTIHVEDESSEPSVIEITDARVKVDRAIAEGAIEVEVKGDAIFQNGYDEDLVNGTETVKKSDQLEKYGRFSDDYYAKVEVANVITPADADTKAAEPAKFVIGNAEYQVGDEVKTADVAPYIKDGRTMLSLRYVAEAMGVSNENIMWDAATRTVTIFKGDRIAQVQIGSDKLMVGGATITMDTVAEIKDGRTMLPVSFVAKALGAEVEWDGATRTVTIK